MTKKSSASEEVVPERGFDQAAILSGIAGLFGADRSGAEIVIKALKELTARTDNWPDQAQRLDKLGLGARHIKATLYEALQLPGEIALLYLQLSLIHI